MRGTIGLAVLVSAMLAGPAVGATDPGAQAALDRLAATIGYRLTMVDNSPDCPASVDNCFLSTITLTLPDTLPQGLKTDGLALYFSFVNRLPLVESDLFDHQLVNGDVQRLTLKPGARLRAGATHEIKLWGVGANFSKAFAMPNAYLVADELDARTIAATRARIDPDTGLETLTFVAPMSDEAGLATKSPDDATRWLTPERAYALHAERAAPMPSGVVILPRPATVRQGTERVDLSRGVALSLRGATRGGLAPALSALVDAGIREGGSLPLAVRVDPAARLADEGYVLDVRPDGITVTARDMAGASHALRSLAQQRLFEGASMRTLHVADAPHYRYRGLHVDIGRNFQGRDQILKLVEAMAAFKLNKLHLHLAEDEGWRIEIPALPELAEIGSRRCHDPSEQSCLLPQLGAGPDGTGPVNGYLSVDDYVAIVRAAAARQIEVIPSIDMPGHSRAAIHAMEVRHARLTAAGRRADADRFRLIDPADTTSYRSIQNYDDNTLNVCIPATYRFFDTVVDALAEMHRTAGAPLKTFHLGADETAGAWVQSPACKTMIAENGGDARNLTPRFIERVAQSLTKRGLRTGGWSDGMGHTDPARMPKDAQTNIWGVLHTGAIREAHDQMNRGWNVVLSIPDLGYFDMPYAPHPEEGGYDWATRGVDTWKVFGFMPDNLTANAARIANIMARPTPIADEPRRQPGTRIAGLQAQLWTETIRTGGQVEYMLFPRLLALAERAWSPAPWTPAYQPGAQYSWGDPRVDQAALAEGWHDFAGRVSAQFALLDRAGIAYRVAPPGARIERGMLSANTDFPGMTIEYRVAGGKWTRYDVPVRVRGPVDLRTRSADGRRASRTVRVAAAR